MSKRGHVSLLNFKIEPVRHFRGLYLVQEPFMLDQAEVVEGLLSVGHFLLGTLAAREIVLGYRAVTEKSIGF